MRATNRRIGIFLTYSTVLVFSLTSQTIREGAERRFDTVKWAESGDLAYAQELPGKNLPGGNETFPVLTPANGSAPEAIYPVYRNLGVLDFTSMDSALLSVARQVSDQFESGAIDPSFCSVDRPWLATLANYRLKSFPRPDTVRFSAADNANPEEPSVRYSLGYGPDGTSRILTVVFSKANEGWTVWDVRFDGERNGIAPIED